MIAARATHDPRNRVGQIIDHCLFVLQKKTYRRSAGRNLLALNAIPGPPGIAAANLLVFAPHRLSSFHNSTIDHELGASDFRRINDQFGFGNRF